MPVLLSTNQQIKANRGDPLVKGVQKSSLPGGVFGGIQIFTASGAPNVYLPISDDGNTWNPAEGPSDYGAGYTTRLISCASKSTNSGNITVSGEDVSVELRPGSGFMLSSPFEYASQTAMTIASSIAVSGADADYYSALWAVG